ncbi:MAG: HupE/UreJ family protein [Acidobacteriota bacterium]
MPVLIAHGVSAADAAWLVGVDGPAVAIFGYLGAKHMVTGYDHLLFLAGVIFFLYRLRDVVLYVSLFTLGHSLTLLGGVLGDVRANPHLVDALIGFSVVYKGFENLGGFERVRGIRPNPKAAVTLFGLVHGFGLATKLQDFALPANGLVINMISFNVGVEIGQLLALSILVFVFAFWRRQASFGAMTFAANSALMACGFLLIGFQLGGYASEGSGAVALIPQGASAPLAQQPDRYMADEVSFTLEPGRFVEYKYRVDKGAPVLFSWRATREVEYDFHTEPQNTGSSDVVSFEKGTAAARLGSYVAPFDGLHGWYWKNTGSEPVTVTVHSTGFYRGPIEFRMDGTRVPHTLRPLVP